VRASRLSPFRRQAVEISGPPLLVLDAKPTEIGPGIDLSIMQVVEGDAHRTVADRLQPDDPDISAPGDQRLLPRSMPRNLGQRASIRSSWASRS
jgi:hypothetical protein